MHINMGNSRISISVYSADDNGRGTLYMRRRGGEGKEDRGGAWGCVEARLSLTSIHVM